MRIVDDQRRNSPRYEGYFVPARPRTAFSVEEMQDEPSQNTELLDLQNEGEDDLDPAGLRQLNATVVSGSDWTTETILRQLERGNIALDPEFQRRDAWRSQRKSRFIESLILGLPIPQLVLAESKANRGKFLVIDGKQRLLALRQFASTATDPEYRQLKLEGLQVRKDLNGMTLEELRSMPQLSSDVTAFENQTIRTVVIRNWPNESVLYLIFLRLNTGSVQLSPQELRQALHPGKFVQFADKASREMISLQKVLGRSEPDFRMRDVELLIRHFAFRGFLNEYRGNLKNFLDIVCKKLNEMWIDEQFSIESRARELDNAINATFEVFGDNAFRKWNGSQFENRFNRAVFDVMTFYFADEHIRAAALRYPKLIKKDFVDLCADHRFVRSIEVSTKSITATVDRLQMWGNVLAKRLKKKIPTPRTLDGAIRIP